MTLTPHKPEVGRSYFQASCKVDALSLVADGGSNSSQSWTRLQPIRTAAEVGLDFAILPREAFRYQEIAEEARRMRKLGMSFRAIGKALGVDDKTARKAVDGREPRGVNRRDP